MIPFKLSTLNHTWFIDLDGTILEHNGYLLGEDKLLPGVKEFWANIPLDDYIVITTGREKKYQDMTLDFLTKNNLRHDAALFGLPLGERIVVNDTKPEGLQTALAWNVKRNKGL
jgi:hypothetical protein